MDRVATFGGGEEGESGPGMAHARHLRFVAPRKFADLGTIPVTKRDSIAVDIFGRSAGCTSSWSTACAWISG